MGYLHDGHLSLVKIAQAACDVVVVSIFVNPTQFGADEDLERYPHDMEGDLAKISAAGAQVVFAPSVNEIYDGDAPVQVSIPALSRRLCGVSRPHHFDGVCQVVLKLFGAVRCDVAVFGEKDFQQLAIIRRLAKDLFLDTEIKSGPISKAQARALRDDGGYSLPMVLYIDAMSVFAAITATYIKHPAEKGLLSLIRARFEKLSNPDDPAYERPSLGIGRLLLKVSPTRAFF